jgi:hypothetical protein
MSVFFSSEPVPDDPQLAELWSLLENEYFADAAKLAESVCRDVNAPVEYVCGLSLAYGELALYQDAENVARAAVSFGEAHWRARQALAVALMHEGRFLGALDTLGFYREPEAIYLVRAQVEKMGGFVDGLGVTLEDALRRDVPPAIHLYLAYLYGSLANQIPGWDTEAAGFSEVVEYGAYVGAWERDLDRHRGTPYADHLNQHLTAIRRLLSGT